MANNSVVSSKDEKVVQKKDYKIMGLSIPMFFILAIIVLASAYFNVLPKGMIGALAVMMIVGAVLNLIGDHLPIVKDYLGGGPIVVIFASAALVTYKVFPKDTIDIITSFMTKEGFLDFYIAALITGSILGMNRKLLIKASVRYIPAILGCVVFSLLFVGIAGALMGYGATKAIFYIGIPIIGGGMGAGAVPLSKIFGSGFNVDPAQMLSVMVPAVALGNAFSIVLAGILDKVGKGKPKLTGNGNMLIDSTVEEVKEEEEAFELDLGIMGNGLLIALTFFCLGSIIAKFIPGIHQYAWMILSVAAAKILGLIPRKYELAAAQWYQFIVTNFTSALLVGIGVAYTDLGQVIAAFSGQYLILVIVTVLGAALGAGLAGRLVGFYPIESAITAGLCMANMGGTGDVAVLSSAKRMGLMPFAQISSRIGGAMILIIASTLIKIFS
ncbi:2-hydroxycarboxylate transporter family protein [uncultured Clostridium sp.]|uniref:2-hydroxycarboxylate transporter family protein n=1 Tax=uncultured Clostridium sp. TaxID=59620 RepID=UPI0028E364A7|nr:2-hydroxycarboxylate transporter family protein [uncultured Clostridium sp.]